MKFSEIVQFVVLQCSRSSSGGDPSASSPRSPDLPRLEFSLLDSEVQLPGLADQVVAETVVFLFADLPSGRYEVTVEADGFEPKVETCDVVPGEVRIQKVALSPRRD